MARAFLCLFRHATGPSTCLGCAFSRRQAAEILSHHLAIADGEHERRARFQQALRNIRRRSRLFVEDAPCLIHGGSSASGEPDRAQHHHAMRFGREQQKMTQVSEHGFPPARLTPVFTPRTDIDQGRGKCKRYDFSNRISIAMTLMRRLMWWPDGQNMHARHARFARRANMPQ